MQWGRSPGQGSYPRRQQFESAHCYMKEKTPKKTLKTLIEETEGAKRKLVWAMIKSLSTYDIDNKSPSEFAELLNTIVKDNAESYERIKIKCTIEDGYDEPELVFDIMGQRRENDIEYNARKSRMEQAEALERARYEALKKKYEGK